MWYVSCLKGVSSLGYERKITLHFIAIRFRSDLVYLKVLGAFCPGIEPNWKPSLSCVEDSANEDQTKMA